MYKTILCWRYLRSRWIALASIISVTLGVATLIVVNAVMQGFSTEMEDRMHDILSDITVSSRSSGGFWDADGHMDLIRRTAGEYIAGMTPTVHTFAMLSFSRGRETETHQVQLIGIDEKTYSSVGGFGEYLQHPANREKLSFQLRKGGYDERDHQSGDKARPRPQMRDAGWKYRRRMAEMMAAMAPPLPETPPPGTPQDPFLNRPEGTEGTKEEGHVFDPAREQRSGLVLGIATTMYRDESGAEMFRLLPGDDVRLTFPTSSDDQPKAESDLFTVVDLFESKMSEYDTTFVFVPIRALQIARGMIDPTTGVARATQIHIRLKEGVDPNMVRDKLRAAFLPQFYVVQTWRDNKGSLLQAIDLERLTLNILLFMIILVAGFGILATFYMIVVEKTRDIGILKSLGASSSGIMGIFLGYGFSLGIVGAGAGAAAGLLIVRHLTEIVEWIGEVTGKPVFDPTIYYFQEIPAIVQPFTLTWIVLGAMLIALLASVLPAFRAARFQPVEALRYE